MHCIRPGQSQTSETLKSVEVILARLCRTMEPVILAHLWGTLVSMSSKQDAGAPQLLSQVLRLWDKYRRCMLSDIHLYAFAVMLYTRALSIAVPGLSGDVIVRFAKIRKIFR